jgi:2-polyprenyl-3-methyl-5-hydroxy-6-metoxy-1,4-benzoquinol methylase
MNSTKQNEIYDSAYAERYRQRAQSDIGRKIYASRWALIEKYCHGKMRLLDYGCAGGAFHLSSTNGYMAEGYDINPAYGFNKTPLGYFNVITMWDSIEHMHEPWVFIQERMPQWLFLSTPNLESVKGPVKEWKHFRPAEHVYYFDQHSLRFHLEAAGYEIMEFNYDEGALRDPSNPEAIITCVARLRG